MFLLQRFEPSSVVAHVHILGLLTLPLLEVGLVSIVVIFVLRKLGDQSIVLAGRMGVEPEIGEYFL